MKKYFILALFLPWLIACKSSSSTTASAVNEKEINALIDNWHRAAAEAKGDDFFDALAPHAVYIGTDASERWTKDQFYSFAKPYFDKGKAWDFKPYDRDLHVTSQGDCAWFSELLTTWMGVCRGSGVLRKTPNGWKIEQYHLSVTVPNDIIRDFISLVDSHNMRKQ
jgi:ketosteroid isomerase-like protein